MHQKSEGLYKDGNLDNLTAVSAAIASSAIFDSAASCKTDLVRTSKTVPAGRSHFLNLSFISRIMAGIYLGIGFFLPAGKRY